MENKIKYILVLLLAVLLESCNLDLSGFVKPHTPVDERFSQSKEWNNSNPARILFVSETSYTVHIAGDSHIGSTVNFRTLFDSSSSPKTTALFVAGDITTGKKEDYDVLKQFTDSATGVCYNFLVGNHDLYFDGWKSFYQYYGSSTYTLSIVTPTYSDLFICLDSGSGTLGDDQMEWLIDILANYRSSHRNCFIITHVNFFRNGMGLSTNPNVEEIHVLLDLFAQYNVNYVITGHDHDQYVETFGGTTYITMDAIVDNYDNATYLELNVSGEGIQYEFVDLQ